jgi:hypothetical protein
MPHDLSHLPPATPAEVRVMVKRAGLNLPEELLEQFVAAWPEYEAMVRRIPRGWAYTDEPSHTFRPARIAEG